MSKIKLFSLAMETEQVEAPDFRVDDTAEPMEDPGLALEFMEYGIRMAMEAVETASAMCNVLTTMPADNISPANVAIAENTLRSVVKQFRDTDGMDGVVSPSLYGSDYASTVDLAERVNIATEGFVSFIKSIIQAIIDTFKKIWAWLTGNKTVLEAKLEKRTENLKKMNEKVKTYEQNKNIVYEEFTHPALAGKLGWDGTVYDNDAFVKAITKSNRAIETFTKIVDTLIGFNKAMSEVTDKLSDPKNLDEIITKLNTESHKFEEATKRLPRPNLDKYPPELKAKVTSSGNVDLASVRMLEGFTRGNVVLFFNMQETDGLHENKIITFGKKFEGEVVFKPMDSVDLTICSGFLLVNSQAVKDMHENISKLQTDVVASQEKFIEKLGNLQFKTEEDKRLSGLIRGIANFALRSTVAVSNTVSTFKDAGEDFDMFLKIHIERYEAGVKTATPKEEPKKD